MKKGFSIEQGAGFFVYADILKGFSGNPIFGHSDAQRVKLPNDHNGISLLVIVHAN